ncbi:MAG: hypothetical protein MJ238_06530, partial [Bacilli bacterium]|nr:hypothetical protein [Bacilli bacterium]
MNTMRIILSNLKKADNNFSLIKNGERILVHIDSSLSSVATFNALCAYTYYSKKEYNLVPVYLDYGYDSNNVEKLKSIIKDLKIVDSREIKDNILARGNEATKSAWNKLERKKLIELAKEFKCSKIALPSIHEDSLNHLYRSFTNEGRISTLRPIAKINGEKISFIRPLIYCYLETVRKYGDEHEISLEETTNPFAYKIDGS